MDLQTYLNIERGNATVLAEHLGISLAYLFQMASGYRVVSPSRAVKIELFTDRLVTRQSLLKNWREIWPELESPHATTLPKAGGEKNVQEVAK